MVIFSFSIVFIQNGLLLYCDLVLSLNYLCQVVSACNLLNDCKFDVCIF